MASVLTLNAADFWAPPEKFPEYTDVLDFPVYIEPALKFPTSYIRPIIMPSLDSANPVLHNPVVNKSVENVIRTPGRQPSPQPTHFSVPLSLKNGNGNGNGHRVLRSATVGYVAPEFEGKKAQMEQGMLVDPYQESLLTIGQ